MNRIITTALLISFLRVSGASTEFKKFYEQNFPEQKDVFDSRKNLVKILNIDTSALDFSDPNGTKFLSYYPDFYSQNKGIVSKFIALQNREQVYPVSRLKLHEEITILFFFIIKPDEDGSYCHQMFASSFNSDGIVIDQLKIDGYFRSESLIDYSSKILAGKITVKYFNKFRKQEGQNSTQRFQNISYKIDSSNGRFISDDKALVFSTLDNQEMINSLKDIVTDYLTCAEVIVQRRGNADNSFNNDFTALLVVKSFSQGCLQKGFWLFTSLANSHGILLFDQASHINLDPSIYSITSLKMDSSRLCFRIDKKQAKTIELQFNYAKDTYDKSWILNKAIIIDNATKKQRVESSRGSNVKIYLRDIAILVKIGLQ